MRTSTKQNVKYYLLALVVNAAVLAYPAKAGIIMSPYLQAMTDSSVIVMLETDNQQSAFVEFGTDSKLGRTTKTSFYKITPGRKKTYIHRIKLTGLSANTEYFYRAIHQKDTSQVFSFRSAPLPGNNFRIGAMGDFRNNPEMHNILARELKKHKPNLLLYTGDLCGNGSYSAFKEEFFVPEQLSLLAMAPMYNSLGNHENYSNFTDIFLQAPESDSGDEFYYSFEYGDLYVLVINTEGNYKKGGKQWKFIERDIKRTDKKWRIAVFHRPAYSAGGHGGDKAMQVISQELLVPNGINAVLNGHNHFYQRNHVDGVYHIVLGGGGAPLYDPKSSDFTIKSAKEFHYAVLDVEQSGIKVKVYDIYGKVFDEFSIEKP